MNQTPYVKDTKGRIGFLGQSIEPLYLSPGFYALFQADASGHKRCTTTLTTLEAMDLLRYLTAEFAR